MRSAIARVSFGSEASPRSLRVYAVSKSAGICLVAAGVWQFVALVADGHYADTITGANLPERDGLFDRQFVDGMTEYVGRRFGGTRENALAVWRGACPRVSASVKLPPAPPAKRPRAKRRKAS